MNVCKCWMASGLAVLGGLVVGIAPLRAQTVTATVTAGTNPNSVAVNPVTNTIYVANGGSQNVTVIDGATNATSTVSAGKGANAIAVNTLTNKIYVANQGAGSVTVIDGATNNTTSVTVGSNPYCLAVNPVTNKIYVANYNSNNVTVIDGATNATTTVAAGTGPTALALNPVTNQIYVANVASNNITVIDGASNNTTTIGSGTTRSAVAVNPVTNLIYVSNENSTVSVIDGSTNSITTNVGVGSNTDSIVVNPVTNKIYVINAGNQNVSVIDGATNTVTATVGVGINPIAIAVNPTTNTIYVGGQQDNSITVINGATNTTQKLSAGTAPAGIGVNPVTNKIYVANYNSNNVTVIDGATNGTTTVGVAVQSPQVVAVNPGTSTIYVIDKPVFGFSGLTIINGTTNASNTVVLGVQATAMAVNPYTNTIYITSSGSNNVTVFDGATNASSTVAAGTAPQAVAINTVTNKIYAGNTGSNNVTVIDGVTSATTTVAVGTKPVAIDVNPVTNQIYVVNQTSNNVTVIDGATNATSTVAVGTSPQDVAVDPVTNKIYVTNNGSNNVTVIDGATNATSTVAVGTGPQALAVNPVANKIYVLNSGSSNVTVVDGATNATTTVAAGTSPVSLAVNQVSNKIYVVNQGSNNLTVIDGTSNNTTTVGTGTHPSGVAVNPVTNEIYVSNIFDNDVSVLTEQQTQTIPLTTTITPLTGNTSSSSAASLTFTAASTFAPNAPTPNAVYFQLDTWQGPWTAATNNGGGSFSGTTSSLQGGFHIVYAYATDGQDATSTETTSDATGKSSPLIGTITAYGFLSNPPVPTPGFSPSPATIPFGNQTQGVKSSAMSVTITNTGSANLTFTGVALGGTNAADFAISADTCNGVSVAGNGTCAVSVTFTPSTTSAETASIQFTDNAAGSPQSVGLTGTGVAPAPVFSPSISTIPFGSQPQGVKSAAMTVTVTNTGTGSLTFTGVALAGTNAADFAISADTCNGTSVAINGTCTVSVTFTPSIVGAESASLKFTDNAANSPQSLALTGTGTPSAPVFSPSPASIPFGSQPQGVKTAAMSVTVTNTGNASLTISAVAVSGANAADFAISADTCNGTSISPNGTCTVSLTFTPSTVGGESASLKFTDNAANSPQGVGLTGTGVTAAPVVGLSPTSLTFPAQGVGTSSTAQGIALNNTGNVALTITGITLTGANNGDFMESDNCNGSVAAGAKCTINITFKPTATGTRSAAVSIADNAAGSPQTAGLTGTAVDFSMDIASGGSSSATISAGQPASYNLQVTPANGFNATVTISCTGAPSEATCTPSSPSVTLNGNTATQFTVNVTTTAPSMVLPLGDQRYVPPTGRLRTGLPFFLVFLLLVAWGLSGGTLRRRPRRFAYASVFGFLLLAGALLAGCNSSSHHDSGTPQGTYTLTITGTSNGVSHTRTVSLTVN